jgi:hypothetical protein
MFFIALLTYFLNQLNYVSFYWCQLSYSRCVFKDLFNAEYIIYQQDLFVLAISAYYFCVADTNKSSW